MNSSGELGGATTRWEQGGNVGGWQGTRKARRSYGSWESKAERGSGSTESGWATEFKIWGIGKSCVSVA